MPPATEVENDVNVEQRKKNKKSKKNKKLEEEEQSQNDTVEESEQQQEEEKPKKKKNKNKKAEEEEEAAPQPAEEAEEESDDTDVNELVNILKAVSDDVVEKNKPSARKVVKSFTDAISVVAAAIALLESNEEQNNNNNRGNNNNKNNKKAANGGGGGDDSGVSPLSQREGFTTYVLSKSDDEIRGKSFAFSIIKRILGEEEGENAISRLTFSKDRHSLVFDLPTSYNEQISENWYNSGSLSMNPITSADDIPELEENQRGGGGGGFGGGRGGGFGGGRGGGGGFGGGRGRGGFGGGRGGDRGGRGGRGRGGFGGDRGGFKRSFDDNNGSAANKKIKFDED